MPATESDGEILDYEDDIPAESEEDVYEVRHEECPDSPRTERRNKIKKIDEEMRNKIMELHELTSKKGMNQSAEMLGKCLTVCEGNSFDNSKSVHEHDQIQSNGNFNSNATKKHRSPTMSVDMVEMIYRPAVRCKQDSFSSEDEVDTSDEFIKNLNELIIAGRRNSEPRDPVRNISSEDEEQPSTSDRRRGNQGNQMENRKHSHQQMPKSPEEITRDMVREAERAKANIFPQQGNLLVDNFNFAAKMDEDYMVIGAHLDELVQKRIVSGDYVDFGRLIPRDRIISEEDERMELVLKNGKAFWTPVASTETANINCFSKWEQAFRIFSNVYTWAHPHHASELIQYNHVVHTISMSYAWGNVYAYDKEFCMHLSKHKERSWAIILQQAWSMRLKDRIRNDNFNGNMSTVKSSSKGNEPCRRFNRGRCNFGTSCRYEHHCSYCGKFGHGFFNCQRADKDKRNSSGCKETFHDISPRPGRAKSPDFVCNIKEENKK